MKRVFVLAVLPVLLLALEKVNLIKDAGFEKDSELWLECAGGDSEQDPAVANRHDSGKSFSGEYSASSDTREMPINPFLVYEDTALIIQGFLSPKSVTDFDSLTLEYSAIPCDKDTSFLLSAFIAFYLNAGQDPYWLAGYLIHLKGHGAFLNPPWKILKIFDFPADTLWHSLSMGAGRDLADSGFSELKVDSFFVMGWGAYFPPWRGQKIYWDDIRLTGYADYDVGVKEILSGDSLEDDTPYTPIARIKNFGRENAPEFSVIAEIFEGTTRVYYDSLPWSLTSDTEDTVTFAAFTPSGAANHTLVVRTSMSPDESDEDDEMTKTLYGSGVEESVTPLDGLKLDVAGASRGVLKVSFETPNGQVGNLTVYDASGRKLESLKVQGTGQVNLRSELASGVYFVKLETKHSTLTKKAVILR